jgi:hypothetical protein
MLLRLSGLFALFATTIGCSEPLEGFEWDVTLTGEVDLCNPEPIGFRETFRYRLSFSGAATTLSLGPDAFAQGTISGCRIAYQSVVWAEERDGHEFRWLLEGEAFYRQGSGCTAQLPNNVDWLGTETFTIVETDHPDIPPNCTYQLSAEGVYIGEASR